MTTRRLFALGSTSAAAALLSSCGTIIYPDRVHQEDRGNLDPAVIILDGIGLFFFLIPGVIAFAVDFATGAIYLPADKEPGDEERTIFDDLSRHVPRFNRPLRPEDIEQAVTLYAGVNIDLKRRDIRVARLDHIGQFWPVHARLAV